MAYTLEQLEMEAEKFYEGQRVRMRQRYKLAREMGFSPGEAKVLSGKAEATIYVLAMERGKRKAAP